MPFELGSIECAFARQLLPTIFLGGEAGRMNSLAQLLLGAVPLLVRARAFLWPQRQLDCIFFEPKVAIDAICQGAEVPHLLDRLVVGAEDVRIVLRELTNANQSVQRPMRLVPVAAAVLVEADRQLSVAGDAL